jgi:hypothetical protein
MRAQNPLHGLGIVDEVRVNVGGVKYFKIFTFTRSKKREEKVY